jgi:phosphomannomutase
MIFRAYDIRGVVGRDLTPEIAEQIGLAFASEMGDRGAASVIIGQDNRLSSPALATALITGIRAAGLTAIEIGEVPTPCTYHASVTRGNLPAIMITGSHLPPDRNGFKMTVGTDPFFGDDIQRLRQRIETEDYRSGVGGYELDLEAGSRYMMDLTGRFSPAQKPLKLVVDAGNGMAGLFAPGLLRVMGHTVVELYCNPDGTYPNHPADPFEEENLLEAAETVRLTGADLGLAFDGDADRLGMIDHTGISHTTDRLLIPLVWDVLKRHPGATIITDPLVSQVLIDMIKAAGGVPLMWKSGHSYIKNKMKEIGAPLALETSGHVFIADDYYGYDDGIFVGLRMVEILSRANTASLAEIMGNVPALFTTPQYRPDCPDDKKQLVIDDIAKAFQEYDLNLIDGVRVALPWGWFICRASNTEPKLSLRFEAQSEDYLGKIVAAVEHILLTHQIEL